MKEEQVRKMWRKPEFNTYGSLEQITADFGCPDGEFPDKSPGPADAYDQGVPIHLVSCF